MQKKVRDVIQKDSAWNIRLFGTIILKWLLKKPDVRTWTELGLLPKAAVTHKR